MLSIKYRPNCLETVFGHKEIVESLLHLFEQTNIPHSFLFSGPSGTGKTTFARIIANMLEANINDIIEINIANTNGVDFIRSINEVAKYSPLLGKNKVYILDEVQMLTKEGQNCLLKMLEDSPKHSYFILCTTDPQKLLKALKDRCLSYVLNTLSDKDIGLLLKYVIDGAGIVLSEDILNLLIYKAEGCPRKALMMLDQVKDINDFDNATKLLADELDKEQDCIEILKNIIYKKKTWSDLMKLFNNVTIENETIRITFANYLSGCLKNAKTEKEMVKFGNLLSLFLSPLTYGSGRSEITFLIYKAWYYQ